MSAVYDVTKYLEDHPGGGQVLVECAGTDATEAFEEIGHSDEARDDLEKFYVGDLPSEVGFPLYTFLLIASIHTNWLSPGASRVLRGLPSEL